MLAIENINVIHLETNIKPTKETGKVIQLIGTREMTEGTREAFRQEKVHMASHEAEMVTERTKEGTITDQGLDRRMMT